MGNLFACLLYNMKQNEANKEVYAVLEDADKLADKYGVKRVIVPEEELECLNLSC